MAARKSFLLRLDPKLFDELQAWAAAELRSVNGQIEYVLVSAIRARRRKAPDAGRAACGPDETGTDPTPLDR